MQLLICWLSVLFICIDCGLCSKCYTQHKGEESWYKVKLFCKAGNPQMAKIQIRTTGFTACVFTLEICLIANGDHFGRSAGRMVLLPNVTNADTSHENHTCYVYIKGHGFNSSECTERHKTMCEDIEPDQCEWIGKRNYRPCVRRWFQNHGLLESECDYRGSNDETSATPSSIVTVNVTSSGVTTAQTSSGVTAQTSSSVTAQTSSGVAVQTSSGVTTAQTSSGVTTAQTSSGVTTAQTSSSVTAQTESVKGSNTTASFSKGKTPDEQIVENICRQCDATSRRCVWVPSDGRPVEEVNRLIQSLLLERKTLSTYKRSMTSAEDNRPSAQAIGQTGVVLVVLCFVVVVLLDAGRYINWLDMRRRRRMSFNSP